MQIFETSNTGLLWNTFESIFFIENPVPLYFSLKNSTYFVDENYRKQKRTIFSSPMKYCILSMYKKDNNQIDNTETDNYSALVERETDFNFGICWDFFGIKNSELYITEVTIRSLSTRERWCQCEANQIWLNYFGKTKLINLLRVNQFTLKACFDRQFVSQHLKLV